MSAASPVTDAPTPLVRELDLHALRALADCNLLRPYLRNALVTQAVSEEPLSDDERKAAFERFAQEQRLTSPEDLERFRQLQVLSPEALAYQVELPVRIQRHCQRVHRDGRDSH